MTYGIYELKPVQGGNDYRFIQAFANREDAQKVLDVLESVNTVKFHQYKILELEIK